MQVRLRRSLWIALALLAVLHAFSFWKFGPCDDDFITYRYARNLVEGLGPVYNAGERVEGYSAPGWMLAVALALRCGIDATLFMRLCGVAALALTTLAIAKLWRRRHAEDPTCAPALLVAASPVIAWHAMFGLGTVLVAALLALAFERWDAAQRANRAPLGAAVAFGFAALVRNEAVLLALPFLAHTLRRKQLASASLALAPLVAWQAFRLAYYGRWTPITYDVKKLALADDLRFGLEYLARSSATTGLIVASALMVVVLARSRERRDDALWAASVGSLVFIAYVVYVGGDFLPFARFFVPVLPLVLLAACDGAWTLFAGARRYAWIALVVALGFEQLAQRERTTLLGTHESSEERWAALGRAVARSVPPTTKVGLAPIGAFGYESRLYVVDFLGLTNSAIARVAPDLSIVDKGHQRYDAEWVLGQEPEMLILGNGWLHPGPDGVPTLVANPWEKTLVTHPRFRAEYEPLQLDIEGSYPLIFYWRRNVSRPSGAREM